MNDTSRNPVEELLKVVDDYRERECRAIRAAAEKQANDIIVEAYRGARERLHAAVVAERRRMQERVENARVQLETEQRERKREIDAALLREAWSHLAEQVRSRWQDPAARRQWLAGLVEIGLKALPRKPWEVHHPPALEPEDRAWLQNALRKGTGAAPTFAADANIIAGVRLEVDGATLDGTLEGILADRTSIEALLLAEAEKEQR